MTEIKRDIEGKNNNNNLSSDKKSSGKKSSGKKPLGLGSWKF